MTELLVNGVALPKADEALKLVSEKLKKEYESEAGTTLVTVTRNSRLKVQGSWTLTGRWMSQFRAWAAEDTVTVSLFFPSNTELADYECQFVLESEEHVRNSKEQLRVDGLYRVTVTMEEL